MLTFLLSNKYLAIAKWIGIAIAVWYIFHTWDKAQNYDKEHKQLLAEIACASDPPTACHLRALKEVEEAQEAVQNARQEADRANQEAKAAKEKASQAEAEKNAAQVQKHNAELAAILAKHTLSCDEWSKEINTCPMQ